MENKKFKFTEGRECRKLYLRNVPETNFLRRKEGPETPYILASVAYDEEKSVPLYNLVSPLDGCRCFSEAEELEKILEKIGARSDISGPFPFTQVTYGMKKTN